MGGQLANVGEDGVYHPQSASKPAYIEIGPSAFKCNGYVCSERLYATLVHENWHRIQDINGRYSIIAKSLNEVEVHVRELQMAKALRLDQSQIVEVQQQLIGWFKLVRNPEAAFQGDWSYYQRMQN